MSKVTLPFALADPRAEVPHFGALASWVDQKRALCLAGWGLFLQPGEGWVSGRWLWQWDSGCKGSSSLNRRVSGSVRAQLSSADNIKLCRMRPDK